jgi:uncharacterized membrane protein
MRAPRIGRVAAGFLAAVLAAVGTAVVAAVNLRLTGRVPEDLFRSWKWFGALFLSIAAGVFWLGERCGLIADAYRSDEDTFSLK